MKHSVLVAAMVLGLLNVGNAKDLWKISFEDFKEGETAPGFSASSGRWVIAKEKSPTGKFNAVFAQVQSDAGADQYPKAIFTEGKDLRAIAAQVRVKMGGEGKNQTAGFLLKYRDDRNFMYIAFSLADGLVSFYKVDGGKKSLLEKASVQLKANEWKRMQIFAKEDRVACSVEGQRVFQVKDKALVSDGKVGLITCGDTKAVFDNFSVTNLR